MPTTANCICPLDSTIQAMAKVNNNLVVLFQSMSAAFVGRQVSVIGSSAGCGCTEVQMLKIINDNLIEFAEIVAGGGGALGNSVHLSTNNSGNTTITPTTARHTEKVTVGGSARTSVFIADVAGRADGDLLFIRFDQPATAAIVEEVRNAAAGGTLIYSYTTDGSDTDNMTVMLYFESGAWHPLTNAVPVV